MATHSSVLAWRIPGTAEPGGLLSMGSHRIGHDWSDLAVAAAYYIVIEYYILQRVLHGDQKLCFLRIFNIILLGIKSKL